MAMTAVVGTELTFPVNRVTGNGVRHEPLSLHWGVDIGGNLLQVLSHHKSLCSLGKVSLTPGKPGTSFNHIRCNEDTGKVPYGIRATLLTI